MHSPVSLSTGCPKSPLTTLNWDNSESKGPTAKSSAYLKTRNLHNVFDTKHNPIGYSKIFLMGMII